MSILTVTRTARRTYRCSHCLRIITPGEPYQRHAMTPRDEHNDGTRWRTTTTHLPAECPARKGKP